MRRKLLHCLRFTVYGLRYTVHRSQYTLLLFVYFFLSIVVPATAAPNYDRTMKELSQAVTLHKSLKKEHNDKYDVAFRRDPMRPLVDGQGKLLTTIGLKDGLSVQGIIWSEARPLAVIDGELFGKGDTIDQYTIEEVRQDGIMARNGETVQHIPLERGLPAIGGSLPVPASPAGGRQAGASDGDTTY